MRSSSASAQLWITFMSLALCSCVQKMANDGRLRPLGGEPAQSLTTREPPADTVPQDEPSAPAGSVASRMPPITPELLREGREQFNIYCLPCHGPGGYGDGMIVQRGFLAPPSYHIDRLRSAPDSHFFDVITHGYGAMYSYSDRVPEPERWAIIAYIRALQLSQDMKKQDLDPTEADQLPPKSPGKEPHS